MSFDAALHWPLLHLTGRLLLAILLGGCIGWERELHEHPAGLRTHALVCVGAALITLVDSSHLGNGGRIAAQIVTGIGFLGAGTILRQSDGTAVRGLTTAASIWATAGIGIAVGYGGVNAQIAAVATLLILFTLATLNRFENVLNRRRRRQDLSLVFRPDNDPLGAVSRVLGILHQKGVRTRDLGLVQSADSAVVHMQVSLPRHTSRVSLEAIFQSDQSIIHFEWKD